MALITPNQRHAILEALRSHGDLVSSYTLSTPSFPTPRTPVQYLYQIGVLSAEVGTRRVKDASQVKIDEMLVELGIDNLTPAQKARVDILEETYMDRLSKTTRLNLAVTEAIINSHNHEWSEEVLSGEATVEEKREATVEAYGDIVSQQQKAHSEYKSAVRDITTLALMVAITGEMTSEEYMYKVPRSVGACPYCLRIYIGPDGKPVRVKVSQVSGASNIGRKPNQYQWTIGPLHPNCYCILYRESVDGPPKKSDSRTQQRAEALKPKPSQRSRRRR